MLDATESAISKINEQLKKRGKGIGIRIGIKTTGCSGLSYVLEFVDIIRETDQIFNCKGCSIIVDNKSLPYLTGLTIDYTKRGINEGFEFINPNERDRCGCGTSFRI